MDTDFTADHFKNCTLSNNTMLTLEKICTLDFDSNINLQQVFTENFARLFLLPFAIIISALTISWLGRTRILGTYNFTINIDFLTFDADIRKLIKCYQNPVIFCQLIFVYNY